MDDLGAWESTAPPPRHAPDLGSDFCIQWGAFGCWRHQSIWKVQAIGEFIRRTGKSLTGSEKAEEPGPERTETRAAHSNAGDRGADTPLSHAGEHLRPGAEDPTRGGRSLAALRVARLLLGEESSGHLRPGAPRLCPKGWWFPPNGTCSEESAAGVSQGGATSRPTRRLPAPRNRPGLGSSRWETGAVRPPLGSKFGGARRSPSGAQGHVQAKWHESSHTVIQGGPVKAALGAHPGAPTRTPASASRGQRRALGRRLVSH